MPSDFGLSAPIDPPSSTHDLDLLTVAEVAALLKVTRSWVYEHTRVRQSRADYLPSVKLGKYVRFERQTLLAFIERQRLSARPTNR
jgi:excisionase family DNA binding protein